VTPADWRRRAIRLALATVAYNLLEGLVAMAFGWQDDSLALFGFGADSFIEVASALLVLWNLRDHGNLVRERWAALRIGWLFVVLAAGIAGGALLQLAGRTHPPTTVPGLVISAVSLGFMGWLWRAKLAAAQALDSATLAADAACSLACVPPGPRPLVGGCRLSPGPGSPHRPGRPDHGPRRPQRHLHRRVWLRTLSGTCKQGRKS